VGSSRALSKKRATREREANPLILSGHGVSLRIDGGSLLIRNGFTHYPQKREEHRFFRGDLSLPPRIVILDGSGSISLDVLAWLAEQHVALIRIDWQGNVQSLLSSDGFAADRSKVAWQTATRDDCHSRIAFSIDLITQKIANSIETLEKAMLASRRRDIALDALRLTLDRLTTGGASDLDALRGIEGGASLAYFKAWQGIPLRWTGTGRKPVPEAWRQLGPRNSMRVGKLAKNRNATHPVNAMLNYAYAVLQAQLQIKLVADGYDPTLGIMHHGYRGSPAFVFDMMEPERPKVDRAVLEFLKANPLHPADFTIRADGVCRLNPGMTARIVQTANLLERP
jgi:CRISPR-associated endonuclease Cas1